MNCLNCHRPLMKIKESHFFSHLTYEVCDHCGGMWLDKGALDKIVLQTPGSVEVCSVETLREELQLTSHPSLPSSCPRCAEPTLIKMHFMGEARILLYYCEKCGGIWLDGGELSKINDYIHWFDKKAKPSKFGRFLRHAHGSFFHRIDVTPSLDEKGTNKGESKP